MIAKSYGKVVFSTVKKLLNHIPEWFFGFVLLVSMNKSSCCFLLCQVLLTSAILIAVSHSGFDLKFSTDK